MCAWLRSWYKRHDRFSKNVIGSLASWAFINAVFLVEVHFFGVGQHAANASKSPLGIPTGIAIQGWVFGDRLKAIRRSPRRRPKVELVVRWFASRIPFFLLNQALFSLWVGPLGLSYKLTPFVLSPAAALIHYVVDKKWTFRIQPAEIE